MYLKKLLLLCSLFFTLIVGANAQSTQGKDFWVAILQNSDGVNGDGSKDFYLLEIRVSAKKACNVTIACDSSGFSKTISLSDNDVKTISIPFNDYNLNVYGKAVKKAFHVTSTDLISVYVANSQLASMEAAIVLPTDACGSYYVTQMNKVRTAGIKYGYLPAIFAVLAVENNTEVEIIPTLETGDGHPANKPFYITLNKGEVFAVETTSADNGKDFSGTQIRVKDQKKVAVFVGNRGACIPDTYDSTGDSDNLIDVSYPVNSWGKKFLVVPTKTSKNDLIKFTAADKGAVIYKNGDQLVVLNPYESYEFIHAESNGAFYIESSEPIEIYQYISSNGYDGSTYGKNWRSTGGPSFQYIAPLEQAIEDVNFATFNTTGITNHFLNVIIKDKDESKVSLDGATGFTTFSQLSNVPGYLYASLKITDGSHVLSAPNGVIANIYGTGRDISYAYSAGSRLDEINQSSQYKVTYDGNGATSGSMNSKIYTIGVDETTNLDQNKFERRSKVSFETSGGNTIADIDCGFSFDGWLHEQPLTEVSNNMEENWNFISTDNYGRVYDLITLNTENGINEIKVNTKSSIRERLYSKAIFTPAKDLKLKYKVCSPSGYTDLGNNWEINFKVAVCDQPQDIYCNDQGMLTKGSNKSAALVNCHTASNNMDDRDFIVYATGSAPIYITINAGNLSDGKAYSFKFSDFEMTNSDGTPLKYSDKEKTKNLVREEGGVVNLKADWAPNYITLPLPVKAGYAFDKWNTKADGTGTSYQAGDRYHTDVNTTLYAMWTVNCTPTTDNITASICEGDVYVSLTGKNYSTTGVYCDTLVNIKGCDSLVYLKLDVLSKQTVNVKDTVYNDEDYSNYGFSFDHFDKIGEFKYTTTTVGENGCDSTFTLTLKVMERPFIIPSAFTPYLNDGFNDRFMSGYEVYIYDRYGNLVCHSEDGWDGTYRGKIATPGVYAYILIMKDGEKAKGTIEVVKSKK